MTGWYHVLVLRSQFPQSDSDELRHFYYYRLWVVNRQSARLYAGINSAKVRVTEIPVTIIIYAPKTATLIVQISSMKP